LENAWENAPELIQGPGVLPNRGGQVYIYKRDKKNWAVGSIYIGGHLSLENDNLMKKILKSSLLLFIILNVSKLLKHDMLL